MEAADIHFECHDGFPDVGRFAMSNFARGVVTFHTGYIFRTEPGWNLLATGCFNQPKDGISPLTGVVETDWLPYPFTMNWQLTRPGVVRFEKGEPFCLVFPVPQHALEEVQPEILALESNSELAAQHRAFREKRDQFMARFRAGDPSTLKQAWQKYYFKGELPDDAKVIGDHVQKLRLAAPIDLRPRLDPALFGTLVVTAAAGCPQVADEHPVQNSKSPVQPVAPQTASDPKLDVLCKESFLSVAECEELIAAFRALPKPLDCGAGRKDGFFDHRFLWINSLPTESERTAKQIMQAARFRCIEEIEHFYDEPAPIYSDTIQLVKWNEGMSMPVHADNSSP